MKNFRKSAVALLLIMGLLAGLVPTTAMANENVETVANTVRYLPEGEGGAEKAHTIHWLKGIKPPVMPNEVEPRNEEGLGHFMLDNSTLGYAYYVSPYVAGNGWYDVNKNNPEEGKDARLCFAMASTNVLYWWLEQNKAHIDRYQAAHPGENANAIEAYQEEIEKQTVAQDPSTSLIYKNMVLPQYGDGPGGMPDLPIDYFINGYSADNRVAPRNIPARHTGTPAAGGGLFYDVFGKSILTNRVEGVSYKTLNNSLKHYMDKGLAIVISYGLSDGRAHAITLWGAEYDEAGKLCAIYITDNNDKNEKINNQGALGMVRYTAYDWAGYMKVTTLEQPNGAGNIINSIYPLTLAEDGWQAFEASGKPKYEDGQAFLSPVTKPEHTITFDPRGGAVVPTQMETTEGCLEMLPVPTKDGHVFLGWYVSTGAKEIKIENGDAYTVDTTLYAKWKPIEVTEGEYRISFNGNGGRVSTASMETTQQKIENLPVPEERTGYTFAGWYTEATGGTRVEDEHTFTSSMTLYAHWTPKTITLSFDSNGGSTVNAITGSYGKAVAAPTNPTRAGYTFTGWKPALPDSFPAENGHYTAQWQENKKPTDPVEPPTPGPGPVVPPTPGGGSGIIIPGPGGIIIPPIPGDKETVEHPDGSTTTTESHPDGSKLETTTFPNGGSVDKATDKDGQVVTTAKPVKSGEKTKVTIPEKDLKPGHVAVIVHPDGREEIVRQSVAGENGMTLVVDQEVQVKIVDNSKSFADIEKHWAKEAIEFVTAHELFNGVSATAFAPNQDMSRGMLVKVLHNLENNPAARADGAFADVSEGQWYSDAVSWAASKGIVSGYSDGRFGPTDAVSREQLVSMLYRYAGSPAVKDASLDFKDADKVSSWSANAMAWAVENGIVHGMGDGMLAPQATATRAQLATIMEQFCEVVL